MFDSWDELGRVAFVGVLAYVALIVLLRVSGSRTLSKLSAFDLVITVALGSTLATILLNKDVSLAEGVVAFALLIGLQFAVSWLMVRSAFVRGAVKAEPVLVFFRGQCLEGAMRRARIVESEILAVARGQGMGELNQIEAVVLEADGSLSVVAKRDGEPTAIRDVKRICSERDGLG